MSDFTTWRSLVDGEEIGVIPDSLLTRDDDNTDSTGTVEAGVIFELSERWQDRFDIELSTGGDVAFTEARIREESDRSIVASKDISDKSGGDQVAIPLDEDLQAEKDYTIGLATDGTVDTGALDNVDYPVSSDDGVIEVKTGIRIDVDDGSTISTDSDRFWAIKQMGNLGLSL